MVSHFLYVLLFRKDDLLLYAEDSMRNLYKKYYFFAAKYRCSTREDFIYAF